jgi:hypothetical protein
MELYNQLCLAAWNGRCDPRKAEPYGTSQFIRGKGFNTPPLGAVKKVLNKSCEKFRFSLFFSGSCLITEVIKQLY